MVRHSEMVRDYLSVPSILLLELDFSRGGNARSYLGDGWSGAEQDFTWTEDDDSIIMFDTPTGAGVYALRLTVSPHIRRDDVPVQELTVFVNQALIAVTFYTKSYTHFSEMKFRHDAFGDAPRTTVRLHHPNAVRPSDFGLPDGRRLALAVKRITMARLLVDDDI